MLAVGSAYDEKRTLAYGNQSRFALLEASIARFEAAARDSIRELEGYVHHSRADRRTIGGSVGDQDHLTASIDTEWQRISEQLRLATESFRSCALARLPQHR